MRYDCNYVIKVGDGKTIIECYTVEQIKNNITDYVKRYGCAVYKVVDDRLEFWTALKGGNVL